MSKLILHSGEDVGQAAERFIQAWERAEQGEAAEPETHVTFESWAGLSAVLSPKRVELLRLCTGRRRRRLRNRHV